MADKFENIEDGINLKPLSSDPSNPKNGDLFISDGTPRAAGLWARIAAAWQQFLTNSNTATLTNKSIDAEGTGNSITNLKNANIKAAAAIDATKIGDGTVTNTILAFINTLSSNAQTQLDAKIAKSTFTTKGDVLVTTAASTPTRLAVGTDGQVLTADSAQASGVKWSTPSAAPTRIIAKYRTAAGQSIASGATAIIDFGTSEVDANSIVTTGASWKATIPAGQSGSYVVTVLISIGGTHTAGNDIIVYLYKNGAEHERLVWTRVQTTGTSFFALCGATTIELVATDYIDIRVAHGEASARTLAGNDKFVHVSIAQRG